MKNSDNLITNLVSFVEILLDKMANKPVRLPPLPRLRVKKPVSQTQANPCVVVMSTLLNCWSSNGEGAAECKQLESSLKECMEINVCIFI